MNYSDVVTLYRKIFTSLDIKLVSQLGERRVLQCHLVRGGILHLKDRFKVSFFGDDDFRPSKEIKVKLKERLYDLFFSKEQLTFFCCNDGYFELYAQKAIKDMFCEYYSINIMTCNVVADKSEKTKSNEYLTAYLFDGADRNICRDMSTILFSDFIVFCVDEKNEKSRVLLDYAIEKEKQFINLKSV